MLKAWSSLQIRKLVISFIVSNNNFSRLTEYGKEISGQTNTASVVAIVYNNELYIE